ncbi:MAG: DinB family protein [Gemmatimonadaceae bacterium]
MTQARAAAPLDKTSPFTLLFHDAKSELATTRRVLERVPDGNDDWRPHAKSSSLANLATHVTQLAGFGIAMLTTDEFDALNRRPDPKVTSNAERLKMFDGMSAEFQSLLEKLTWDRAASPWRFRAGDHVIAEGPRAQLIRSAVITHMAHHRAQLGVYLRLLGIPVPSTFGPTADEPMGSK